MNNGIYKVTDRGLLLGIQGEPWFLIILSKLCHESLDGTGIIWTLIGIWFWNKGGCAGGTQGSYVPLADRSLGADHGYYGLGI